MVKRFMVLVLGVTLSCQSNTTKVSETPDDKTEIPVMLTGGKSMPEVWVDSLTGYTVTRLSEGVDSGSFRSFYFHNYPFVKNEDGKGYKMICYGDKHNGKQIYTIDLEDGSLNQVTHQHGNMRGEILARKSANIYYQIKDSVYVTNALTGKTDLITVFPDNFQAGVVSVNANETLLAGTYSGAVKKEIYDKFPEKRDYFNRIYEAKLPHVLFTVNIETGEIDTLHQDNAWLNHVQFSPVDPEMLMFCHEGPWHKVDRIWTINTKTKNITKIHRRTVNREIAGHEFWSPDGKQIWYDLQVPRGETFYLASNNLDTTDFRKYGLVRNEWSVHYTISPSQKLFAGDGGHEGSVAKAPDGKWIYLFKQEGDSLKSTKLVSLKEHDYGLEPNVHFTPDESHIIFRANFEGKSQIYAVDLNSNS